MTTALSRPLLWLGLLLAVGIACAALVVAWPARRPPPAPGREREETPAGPPLLEDVTRESGIAFTYRNGEETDYYTILESLGGGVGLIDYDGDGLLDLYLPGGGTFEAVPSRKGEKGATPARVVGLPSKLYRNLGGMRFRDVTAEVMPAATPFYSHGVAVADYDGDGRPDLLVTGFGGMALYRNEGGQRFVDVTEQVGLKDDRWATSAAFADLSGKGRPDLYVCRYLDWSFANDPRCTSKVDVKKRDVCAPTRFEALPHALYRNDGGKFVEASAAAGLRKDGKGLGVVIADVDGDGRPDVYVANDQGANFLYLNKGGRFDEVGVTAGVSGDDLGRFNGSMGVDVGDFDGSGRTSLWVTNYQGEYHALYGNTGRGQFAYQTHASGLAALGQQYVGFGTGFLDLDNDGWLDLIIVNGHVLRHPVGAPFRQRPVLLRNEERHGRRFFTDVSRRGGAYFSEPALGRGLAVGDLDNDGWPDVVISHSNSPVTVLRNVAGREANWVGVKLVGKGGRPVAGATVTVEAGGRKLTRFAAGGGSYLSSGDARLLFGLGETKKVDRVSVYWPWGETQAYEGVEAGRYWVLAEGEAKAR